MNDLAPNIIHQILYEVGQPVLDLIRPLHPPWGDIAACRADSFTAKLVIHFNISFTRMHLSTTSPVVSLLKCSPKEIDINSSSQDLPQQNTYAINPSNLDDINGMVRRAVGVTIKEGARMTVQLMEWLGSLPFPDCHVHHDLHLCVDNAYIDPDDLDAYREFVSGLAESKLTISFVGMQDYISKRELMDIFGVKNDETEAQDGRREGGDDDGDDDEEYDEYEIEEDDYDLLDTDVIDGA
ncbi:hypothetical protein QR680_007053 [Steinernema hermaphroditum]|uniref:Uncharacterized protein n=1 Tax=Steinernema hermaphroditum TaxID=289476 RepID=A0AA39LXI8_9BILA|nr:hypothetical protein QR680_007053 [Steinernema hermaphroditum]